MVSLAPDRVGGGLVRLAVSTLAGVWSSSFPILAGVSTKMHSMRGRGRASLPVEVPEWLLGLIEEEIDVRQLRGRLTQAGVTTIERYGNGAQPKALRVTGPGLDLVVDVEYEASETPIVVALKELTEFLEGFGPLRQLHAAAVDMDQVAYVARELATYRHVIGGDEDVPHNPYMGVEQVLETGLVVTYARPFTGHARLGDNWRPKDKTDRELHDRLLKLRHDYAHADWTDSRTLVDTTALLGLEGPMVLAEQRARLSGQQLIAIAELAERQDARFYEAAGRLKRRLGAANSLPLDDE